MKKYGIENLKPIVEQLVIFGLLVGKLKSSKSWIVRISIIIKATRFKVIIDAIKNREIIGYEIKDLDIYEIKKLALFIEDKFNLVSDDLENTIKAGFEFLENLFIFINNLKKK